MVASVAFSFSSTRIVSGAFDNYIKIWDASSGACLQTFKNTSFSSVCLSDIGLKSEDRTSNTGAGTHTLKFVST